MPDSCSLSLSISPLCSLPSPFHARSKTSFSIRGQRSFTNRECQSPRPPRGDIFFFSLSFLSLSFCVVLSLHSFVRPSFFYVALSLFPCPSTSLSPVSAQIFRGRRNRSLPPSLLPVRKNQPRLPLPFDGIGLPPTPPERKNRKRGRCSESTSE